MENNMYQLQFINHPDGVTMKEKIFLDEITHVPFYEQLEELEGFFLVDYSRLKPNNKYPRVFEFYLNQESGEEILISQDTDVLLPVSGELKFESGKYNLSFNSKGILQLTIYSDFTENYTVESSEELVIFKGPKQDNDDIQQGGALIVSPLPASSVLSNGQGVKNEISLEFSSFHEALVIKKNELFSSLLSTLDLSGEKPCADVEIVINGEHYRINQEKKSSVLMDPFELVFLNDRVVFSTWGRYRPEIRRILISDDVLKLDVVTDDIIKVGDIKVVPRTKKYDENTLEGTRFPAYSLNDIMHNYEIDYGSFKNKEIFNHQTADVLMEFVLNDHMFVVRPVVKCEMPEQDSCELGNTKMFKTKVNTLAFTFGRTKVADLKKKVVLLGSDYTNLIFESDEYYNGDSVDEFAIISKQSHSSIISLMSDPILPADIGVNIENIDNPELQSTVEGELSKNFFDKIDSQDLKDTYLIFDLYADASLSLIKWGENKYKTGAYYFKGDLGDVLYNNKDSITVITHDNPEFFELWKDAADKFIKRAMEFFDDRIILISSKRTYQYKDQKGKLHLIDKFMYGHSIEVAKSADYWTEKMENYLMKQFPNVKFIDMSKYGFVADKKHPKKLSTNHYESAYYKALYAEVKSRI